MLELWLEPKKKKKGDLHGWCLWCHCTCLATLRATGSKHVVVVVFGAFSQTLDMLSHYM